jgi:hypothetical protein
MEINTIIGILSGSLGTIIVTKTIEYFSAKTAFKRELKRQFFAKKLEAAENAIRFFISAIDSYSMLQNSFDLLINDGNQDVAMGLLNDSTSKCKLLWDSTNTQLNAARLYFDVKNTTNYPIDNQLNLTNLISKLISKNQSACMIWKKLNDGLVSQAEYENTINNLREETQYILTQLKECIQTEKENYNYFSIQIRKEFQKYNI